MKGKLHYLPAVVLRSAEEREARRKLAEQRQSPTPDIGRFPPGTTPERTLVMSLLTQPGFPVLLPCVSLVGQDVNVKYVF